MPFELSYNEAEGIAEALEQEGEIREHYFSSMVPHDESPEDYSVEMELEHGFDAETNRAAINYDITFADGGRVEGTAERGTDLYDELKPQEAQDEGLTQIFRVQDDIVDILKATDPEVAEEYTLLTEKYGDKLEPELRVEEDEHGLTYDLEVDHELERKGMRSGKGSQIVSRLLGLKHSWPQEFSGRISSDPKEFTRTVGEVR